MSRYPDSDFTHNRRDVTSSLFRTGIFPYPPNHRGNVVVSAGTYVISNTPADITRVSGVTARSTSGTVLLNR